MSSLEVTGFKRKSFSWTKSYGERFSNNGQIYDWNKETKEYLEIWKIYLALKLLTPNKLLYKKRLAPSLANLK